MPTNDQELLARYVTTGSDEALAELASQYVDFVYSAAYRQVHDVHVAEDVTQATFLILMKKAGTIRSGTVLSGWLFNVVRYTSANVMKTEARRRYHERHARCTDRVDVPPEPDWLDLAPVLDQALGCLRTADRNAILLRFFHGKSLYEVGVAAGISEKAATKRVARALERLRDAFMKTGLAVSATTLGNALMGQAIQPAPTGLRDALSAALAPGPAAAGVSGAGSAGVIAKGAIKMMAWTKVKLAAAAVAGGLLAGGAIVGTVAADGTTQPARPAPAQGQTSQEALESGKHFLKFAVKYAKRVSFPEKYDGQPAQEAPAWLRDKIIGVHKRYWRNYAQIDQVRFAFSSHTFLQGKPADIEWDMDAQVDMQYGHGIDIEGKDARGQQLHWALSREGMNGPAGGGDVSSLMLSMFNAHMARPEWCVAFSSIEEDVALEGNDQARYDVLVSRSDSDSPVFYDCKHYFNRATGMLDRVVWCDPQAMKQYGHYPCIRMSYAAVDGVYIPTETVMDAPNKGAKLSVQKYSQVELRKREVRD